MKKQRHYIAFSLCLLAFSEKVPISYITLICLGAVLLLKMFKAKSSVTCAKHLLCSPESWELEAQVEGD